MKNVIIIAEAGVNHNGSLEIAKKLVDAAADAKADYVKFQTFKTENLVTKDASMAEYQIVNTKNNDSQFNMLKKLELTEEMHEEIISYCREKGINFLSTPFDIHASDYLEKKVSLFKIASGELTNHPFLEHLAGKRKPIVLSTGMANLEEIKTSVALLKRKWDEVEFDYTNEYQFEGLSLPALTVLHCTTAYPTPMDQVNLNAMHTIAKGVGVDFGYSDHTLGIEVPLAATAMGARIIEKHFTLDREMEGPDHVASLEPDELKKMVEGIRNISIALGTGEKVPQESEKANKDVARKSLYFSRKLMAGHELKKDDFVIKRPGNGISPIMLIKLLGKVLIRDVKSGDKVNISDFK
jgi:N,N'-diacetyllegionaminate synthase